MLAPSKAGAEPMDATTLYRESFVWDDHAGFELSPGTPLRPLLAPWREAGVDYLSINVAYDAQPADHALQTLEAMLHRVPIEAPECHIVATVADIDRARADGKMAVTFDIEGMNALAGRVDLVERYYELGVRHMLIAYNRNNLAGSGCHDEDIGLTAFGRRAIDEMNRVGMVVDCSHCGVETTMAAMERSRDPVIFSHANPKALVNHPRNITDEQIKTCARTGGVVGINGVNLFLGEAVASPAAVARHVAHVAELTGPEHVGLSLDYAPDLEPGEGSAESEALVEMFATSPDYWPTEAGYDGNVGCLDIRRLPEVVPELQRLGFNDGEVAAVLGANFRRVAERVWKAPRGS
jgi:membrane dipeptidase